MTGYQCSWASGCVFSCFGISVYSNVVSKPLTGEPRKNIRVLPSEYARKQIEVGAIVDNDESCFLNSPTISLNSCHVFLPFFCINNLELYSRGSHFSSSEVEAVTVLQG